MTDRMTADPKHKCYTLPWPPSVNRMYRNVGYKTIISAEGRAYKSTVHGCVLQQGRVCFDAARLVVQVFAAPPDKRVRDLDNIGKCLFDSLRHAGVYDDDGQIDDLRYIRCGQAKGGKVDVVITERKEV